MMPVRHPPARRTARLAAWLAALAVTSAVAALPGHAQVSDAARFARYEVRLSQLEEELRRLTGRIERVEYQQRTLEARLDELIGDLDNRLGALEAALRERQSAVAPAPGPAPEQGAQPGSGIAEAPGAQSPGLPPPAPREEVLGSVPESALLGLPRASPAEATPPARASLPPQEQYDSAMELLRAGNYQAAADGLQLFLELNPEHPLAANAAYWLAESHYVRRNYAAAAAAFARNYRTYGKEALKAPDNLLKLGMSLEELGETEKACLSYDELAEEFPDVPAHIRQALERERERARCA